MCFHVAFWEEISPNFSKHFSHMPQSFLLNVVVSIWTHNHWTYTQIFKRDVCMVKGEHVTLLNVIVVWYNVNPCENLGRCRYVIYRVVVLIWDKEVSVYHIHYSFHHNTMENIVRGRFLSWKIKVCFWQPVHFRHCNILGSDHLMTPFHLSLLRL